MTSRARALLRFLPDLVVLLRRLLADRRVPLRRKLLLAPLAAYLAFPFDLVPDFIPVLGQLDDALLVVVVLRSLVRRSPPGLLEEHWPGSPDGLETLRRLAGTSPRA
jgi:uncharacterized membrane protein YkvA (DUF1232 family)